MKTLFEPHTELVGAVMDMQLKRQNVIMSNIANIKTPAYRPRVLDFEEKLQQAMGLSAKGQLRRTEEQHIPASFDPNKFGPDWHKSFKPRIIHGEDRVDIDKEMSALAKNSLQYTALTQVITKNFEGLRNIIQEGQK